MARRAKIALSNEEREVLERRVRHPRDRELWRCVAGLCWPQSRSRIARTSLSICRTQFALVVGGTERKHRRHARHVGAVVNVGPARVQAPLDHLHVTPRIG